MMVIQVAYVPNYVLEIEILSQSNSHFLHAESDLPSFILLPCPLYCMAPWSEARDGGLPD